MPPRFLCSCVVLLSGFGCWQCRLCSQLAGCWTFTGSAEVVLCGMPVVKANFTAAKSGVVWRKAIARSRVALEQTGWRKWRGRLPII